jgi:hypothetical protein
MRFIVSVLLVCSIGGLLLSGCKKEEVKNQECESSCVTEYADSVEKCENKMAQCLSGCINADDWDCTDACEDEIGNCQLDFIFCVGRCPCADKLVDCGRDCQDAECATRCTDGYTKCAGEDSPYTCSIGCQSDPNQCQAGCEAEHGADSPEYYTCWSTCVSMVENCETYAYSSEEYLSCKGDYASASATCLHTCE